MMQNVFMAKLSSFKVIARNKKGGRSSFYLCFHRAWFYCKACHEDIKDENLIKKCKCKNCKFSS